MSAERSSSKHTGQERNGKHGIQMTRSKVGASKRRSPGGGPGSSAHHPGQRGENSPRLLSKEEEMKGLCAGRN